tara:strand:- start:61373 stop:62215 length:843 start_codon:yes stop_codon:yes gene_type:complete
LILLAVCGCGAPAPTEVAQPTVPENSSAPNAIRILAWNVESGGNFPPVIASQLENEFSGYDIYALSEVLPTSFQQYQEALGPTFLSIEAEMGQDDRLQFLVDGERFELIEWEELNESGGYRMNDGKHRSPLMVHLMDRMTGERLKVVNNHLARGDADFREEQASGLREWAREQSVATIAVGDYNFDYWFTRREGNSGFAAMLRDNVWSWVKPAEWVDTNWDEDRDHPGNDRYPDSMLDFAFVAGPAKVWDASCRVIVLPGDFPDNEDTSDHRPVELILTP